MKANGFAEGEIRRANGKANGHALTSSVTTRRTSLAVKTLVVSRWLLSSIARLFTWYAIVSILFRCPSNLETCDELSPAICAPYFRFKTAVAPHVEPYYEAYAATYVDVVRPYYDTVDANVITPGRIFARQYVTPQIAGAQAFAQDQWAKKIQPQLSVYRDLARTQYDHTVAPHIHRISDTLVPYGQLVRSNVLQTHYAVVLPAYRVIQPHASVGSEIVAAAITDTIGPFITRGWERTCAFLQGAIWPKIRVLYGENVEPQLIRIGERLGRYKHGKAKNKMQSTSATGQTTSKSYMAEKHESSSTSLPTPSDNQPSPLTETSSVPVPQTMSKSESSTFTDSNSPAETRSPQQIVADDIIDAQEKVKQAAKEGSVEVSERISEVVDQLLDDFVNVDGDAVVGELQRSIEATITNLRGEINEIAGRAASDIEKAREDVSTAVRRVGLIIKQKSQAVRKWRQQFEIELHASITKAVRNNIRILEGIGDLALQKIGMKWAWMDGVTWRDWKQYHELRANITAWTDEVKKIIVEHDAISKAQDEALELEDIAMEMAQAAATELVRLKQVGLRKVEVGDTSDNFGPDMEDHNPFQEDHTEPDHAEDEPSTAARSDEVRQDNGERPAMESPEEPVGSALGKADQVAMSPDRGAVTSPDPLGVHMSIVGNMSDKQEDEDAVDEASVEEEPVNHGSADPGYVKPVFLGAAAQAVPGREPLLDDDTNLYAAMTSGAQGMYSQAISHASAQYKTAVSVMSAQIYGTPEPIHEQLLASITSAYSVAAASASAQLDHALDAASKGIYGTPTTHSSILPTYWARIESIAAEKLNEGRVWAEIKYESAKLAIGMASPTPTSSVDSLLHQARQNYYAGIGLAHEKYYEFIAAASSAVSALTATPTPTDIAGSASSLASVVGESMASAASAAGDGASSLVSAAGDSVTPVIQVGQEKISEAGKAVAESWEVVVSYISMQVYSEQVHTQSYGEVGAGEHITKAT